MQICCYALVVDICHHAEIGLSIVHDMVGFDINFFDVLVVGIIIRGDMFLAAKNT